MIETSFLNGVNDMSETPSELIDAYTIDGDLFKVLINDEGQYSIWPQKKATPAGWKEKGFEGSKDDVAKFIDENWTDMRPASLIKAMGK